MQQKLNILIPLIIIVLIFFFNFYSNVIVISKKINIFFNNNEKILILYAYFEKNEFYKKSLQYFVDNAVHEIDHIDYVFIIQGGDCTVSFPKYKNLIIINRPNICYDFGAFGKALNKLGGIEIVYNYKAVFFFNPSAIGPFLPKYWPEEIHWTEIFLRGLNENNVQAFGTAIYCDQNHGPIILGMAFAATPLAVSTAYNANVFSCKIDKDDAILSGEFGFSKSILKNGMNIGSLLLKYGKIDFRKKENWNCNDYKVPAWKDSYEGINVNPLEVVFHKPLWDKHDGTFLPEVFLNETILYMKWSYLRKKNH